MRRHTDDTGIATVELGLLLPIMLLLAAIAFPILHVGLAHIVLNRAAAHGIRYASRADTNARYPDPSCPSRFTLMRRPTACEVEKYVRESSGAFNPRSVETQVGGEPGVYNGTPADPADALPGEIVSVRITYEVGLGPAPDVVNAMRSLVTGWFDGRRTPPLPESALITVSTWGRME